jgi:pyruvate/2-oxoacid:ferredoxin oxidoreductase alpha subunit
MFRPVPRQRVRELCARAGKVGVLDRNYAAGTGGIFCDEVRAVIQGQDGAGGRAPLVQGYLTGVGGGDVVPQIVRDVVTDLARRDAAGEALWMGIES